MELHLTLQGKGGVGKTLTSVLLAQYLTQKDHDLLCIDTDPVNNSFQNYPTLNVKTFEIMKKSHVDQRSFDDLVLKIVKHPGTCIVDNGASTFIPLTAYMKENEVFPLLKKEGIEAYIHVPVTGGPQMLETLKGLDYLVEQFSSTAKIVIWLNHYFGEVKDGAENGKTFQEMKVFQNNKDYIYGLINLPQLNPVTFGEDIKMMLSSHQTFKEFLDDETVHLMPKQRIKIYQDKVYQQISIVL